MLGPILLQLNDAATVYVPRVSKEPVAGTGPRCATSRTSRRRCESTRDGDRRQRTRTRTLPRLAQAATDGGPAGKYLVDASGTPVYLVDPGINGAIATRRPDGSEVAKFDAPKATLMSYIIKGILNRQLPWGLVLLGVMIAVVLEMSGIPSLAFAVGVYLPLSSSTPIFIGGMVRWLVRPLRRGRSSRAQSLTEEQLTAEGDKSPGVLMASGYIAGGAIAGIVIAFMAGVLDRVDRAITTLVGAAQSVLRGPARGSALPAAVRAARRVPPPHRLRAATAPRHTRRGARPAGAVEPLHAAAVRRVRPLPVLRAPLPVLRLRRHDGGGAGRAAVRPRRAPRTRAPRALLRRARPGRASTSAAGRPRSGSRARSAR